MEPRQAEPRPFRWRRSIVAGVGLGAIGLAAGWLLTLGEPELIRNLPEDGDAKRAELARRVAARFPPGSSEAEARRVLLDQGFSLSGSQAVLQRSAYPCRTFAEIRWQASSGRIVTTTSTIYRFCT
ncbi:hypothetical protein TPR58_13300 [Sphingomonas sp. HF-S3]|uniref:Uncharacterized protein n=1 Tax=Sphingomonas rustica TaxID=3103142 RepID=A0ABV0BBN3_9SPHN